ncbi:MAG: hypothetical protein NTW04_02010 [Elusimicrobia bacterium]|nr:hypothetical protein [Elusimicrobiota bacterium]
METFYIDCPHCKTRLEVEKKSGRVIKSWEHIEKKDGADPMAEALKKMKEDKSRLEKYFSGAGDEMAHRKKELQDKFEAEKKRIHDSGDTERPLNPMDLD